MTERFSERMDHVLICNKGQTDFKSITLKEWSRD